ncbi:MAG: phosphatase PAP2 family protein [Candidatus Zixiibacteriota bacterium]
MESLQSLDSLLFIGVNQTLANPITDTLMRLITNDWVLRAGYGLALLLTLWKGSRRWRWAALGSLAALALGDFLAATALKPLFERARPCQAPVMFENLRLLVNCGPAFSFPSAHATNSFAVATFFFWIAHTVRAGRQLRWSLLPLAVLIALSRVFVGVHYPGDILAGAVLGALCGIGVALVFEHYLPADAAVGQTETPRKTGGP